VIATPSIFVCRVGRLVFGVMRSPDGQWAVGDQVIPWLAAFVPIPESSVTVRDANIDSACVVIGDIAFGALWLPSR
jgi:hypothetical protein